VAPVDDHISEAFMPIKLKVCVHLSEHSIALINHLGHHRLEDPTRIEMRIGFDHDMLLPAADGLRVRKVISNLLFICLFCLLLVLIVSLVLWPATRVKWQTGSLYEVFKKR
jgi:hypothetical protein